MSTQRSFLTVGEASTILPEGRAGRPRNDGHLHS